jgi:hypothetical protein
MSLRTITSLRARHEQRPGGIAATFRARTDESSFVGRDEDGAVLILAIIFLMVVSLVITAILTWAGTSLTATGSFQTERDTEYGATAAVNLAVQTTRTTFDAGSPAPFLNNPTPELCATYATPGGGSTSVHVYCTMVWQPYSSNTRVFTYSACLSGSSADASGTSCAAAPLLQARFAFYDYPSAAASISSTPQECQPVSSGGACGQNVAQLSWQWNPIIPAVTALSPSTGPVTGGSTVTIHGTGFTGGGTVNFVQQNPVSGTYNAPVAATIVANPAPGCALPTCLQVLSPVVITGTAYYVEVTTPGGTSQTSPLSSYVPIFTYSPVRPTVTANVGTSAGTITGGDTVTVQGTGFWSTASIPQYPVLVSFCPTVGGPCTNGSLLSVTPPPANSTTDTVTALTPPVSASGTYYIEVQSYTYTSLPNSSVEFTYNVHVPLVISLSSSSGGTGSALTITGANFLTGSAVSFCPVANYTNNACTGSTTNATIASPITSTQITVSVPSMAAGSYYPIVTLPAGYLSSPFNASQAYNQPADTFAHT